MSICFCYFQISTFFNYSPKRQTVLEEFRMSQDTETNTATAANKVKYLCRTRWVERHDALDIFIEFLPSIVDALGELMANETRSSTSSEISGFLMAVTSFQFVTRCLAYIQQLTVTLQGRDVDVVRAMSDIGVIQDTLKDVRENVEEHHNQWFYEAADIARQIGVEPCKPRTCGRQTKRDNIDAASPEEYYRRNLTVPFLDTFIVEMGARFSELQSKASMGMKLVPKNMTLSPVTPADLEWFLPDLPAPNTLSAELHLWQQRWKNVSDDLPSTLQQTIQICDSVLYPNIHTILAISCVFPVTSCECERSISTLGLVKSKLRSAMGQERLSALCLLSIHRKIPMNIPQVVLDFARKHPRKMALPNILTEL